MIGARRHVLFMKTPPLEFYAPVPREPLPGRRLMRGSAFERISRLAIFSVALVLAVGAWACSRSLVISEPSSQARFEAHVVEAPIGVALLPTPSPTPQPTPSQ